MFAFQNGQIVAEKTRNVQALVEFRQKAERSASAMIRLHPGYRLGRQLLAAHYIQKGDRRVAAEFILRLASEGNWLESLAPLVYDTEHADKARKIFHKLDGPLPNSQIAMAYLSAEHDRRQTVKFCFGEFNSFPSQTSAVRAVNALLFFGELQQAKNLARKALELLKDFPRPYKKGFERLQFIVDEDLIKFEESLRTNRMSDMNTQSIEFTRGMLALAKGDTDTAARHFRISVTKEPFPDNDERFWAVRCLEKWEHDPSWLPPGPRSSRPKSNAN